MKSDSLAHKAFLELRKKILSNQLLPNTRLKEDEWAKKNWCKPHGSEGSIDAFTR